ncbi:MAG: hypothetical protein WBD02_03495 [Acidimicrobiia bacterium]
MSSLWTPYGEHNAQDSQPESSPAEGASSLPEQAIAAESEESSPEARTGGQPYSEEELREIAAIQQQMLSTPPADLVANHVLGLFEIGMLHLSAVAAIKRSGELIDVSPHLEAARLGIDAVSALVDALGDRLAPHQPTLEQALTQARLAFVELSA